MKSIKKSLKSKRGSTLVQKILITATVLSVGGVVTGSIWGVVNKYAEDSRVTIDIETGNKSCPKYDKYGDLLNVFMLNSNGEIIDLNGKVCPPNGQLDFIYKEHEKHKHIEGWHEYINYSNSGKIWRWFGYYPAWSDVHGEPFEFVTLDWSY